jgi:hypothetical protein
MDGIAGNPEPGPALQHAHGCIQHSASWKRVLGGTGAREKVARVFGTMHQWMPPLALRVVVRLVQVARLVQRQTLQDDHGQKGSSTDDQCRQFLVPKHLVNVQDVVCRVWNELDRARDQKRNHAVS